MSQVGWYRGNFRPFVHKGRFFVQMEEFMKIAIDGTLSAPAKQFLEDAGMEIELIHDDVAWTKINETADGLMYAGNRDLSKGMFSKSGRLKVIARTNQEKQLISLDMVSRCGIQVLEPTRGESDSIADFALYQILSAARRREKGAIELAGKRLGLLGFNCHGAAIAKRAVAFGMTVNAWDEDFSQGRGTLYNVGYAPLVDLLIESDFIINLLPKQDRWQGFFGKDYIQLMKENAVLIHLTHPNVLIRDELIRALDWEYLNHFIIDLPTGCDDWVKDLAPYLGDRLTIHQAADTQEARQAIQLEMAQDLVKVLQGCDVESAVNVPYLKPLERKRQAPWFALSEILGQMLAKRLNGNPCVITLIGKGEARQMLREEIIAAFLTGLAQEMGAQDINHISAALWAKEEGIGVHWQDSDCDDDELMCESITAAGRMTMAGTVRYEKPLIVRMDEYHFAVEPTRHVLLVPHVNRPGMVGQIGTLLGERHINIRGMVIGQKQQARDNALMWIMLDQEAQQELVEKVMTLPGILNAESLSIKDLVID